MSMILSRLTAEEILTLAEVWDEEHKALAAIHAALADGRPLITVMRKLTHTQWVDLVDKTLSIVYDDGMTMDTPLAELATVTRDGINAIIVLYELLVIGNFVRPGDDKADRA